MIICRKGTTLRWRESDWNRDVWSGIIILQIHFVACQRSLNREEPDGRWQQYSKDGRMIVLLMRTTDSDETNSLAPERESTFLTACSTFGSIWYFYIMSAENVMTWCDLLTYLYLEKASLLISWNRLFTF